MPKSAKVTQKVVKKESLTTKEKKVSKSQLAKNQSEESLSSIERKRVKNVAKKKDVTLQHKKELEAILNHHSRFVAIEDSEALYRKERSEDGVDFQNNNETLVPETFKKNALRREKGGVHSSLPKHFAPLDIQDSKVIKNAEPIRTAHRHITLALACLTILIILGSYVSPKGSAESVVFYPTSCLGGWISPNMAEGPPEVDENNDREKFSEGNSAILPSGTNADIYCGGFVGEFKKNTKPTKILVTVSWAKGYDIESKKNIISNSFASSSHEILDSSASTTVSFTSIESSNATTTNIVATSTEEPAHSNNGSGVNLDVTTVSTSTDLQVSPTNDIIASSTQDTSSITPSTPTLLIPTGDITVPQVDSTQQTETQPNLQPEAPRQAPQSTTESPLTPLSLLKQVVTLFAFGGAIKVYADEVVTPVDTSQSVSPEPAPALDTIPLPVTSTPILDQAVDTVSKTDALISTGNDSIDSLLQKADELLSKKVELPDISTTTLIVATQTIQSSEFFDSSASTSFPSSALLNEEASSSALLFSSSSVLIPNDMVATTTLAVSASSTIISVSTNAEDESPNNFLELLYTFDGVTWGSLGKVNEDSIVYRTFEIPVASTTSWDDISTLQVKVKYNGRIDPTPAIYLDAIKIEALYETPVEHEHPDFARDIILKDKSDDDVRVISIINSDTNAREIWYTTIRQQGEFGVEPGSWVKVSLDQDKVSYRLVEIYGRYLFWVDDIGKMMWTMNLEKSTNDGVVLNKNGTTTIPFVKPNGEQWYFDYNNQTREGLLRIEH